MTSKNLPWQNTTEATKTSSNRTERKCTNVTNRRSRVGLSTPFYPNPLQLQDAGFVLVRIALLFTDSIMHNCRSNQSALMTRCGTDLRHQYGIIGSKSQTFFSRNAIRVGSEEGRLFLQVTHSVLLSATFFGLRYI